jgi:hypothetical protein
MIRQHPLKVLGPLKNGQFDAKKMDQWDRWFAAQNQGIYADVVGVLSALDQQGRIYPPSSRNCPAQWNVQQLGRGEFLAAASDLSSNM